MEEKLYKIKKGSEFNFYSTEPSATINKIVGETTQKTREGYNLLKYPYASLFTDTIFTDNGNGTIKLNGNLESNTSKYFVKNYFLKAGTYTFITGLGKDINLPNTSYLLIKKSTESSFLVKGARKDTEFTLDADSNIDISVIYVAGAYNNVLLKPMLISGTIDVAEKKEYEQYGAMPSIDYPSSVNSIKNIDYKITGKNAIYDTFSKTKGFITYKVAKENITQNMLFSGIIDSNVKATVYFSVDDKIVSAGEINIIENTKFSKVINVTNEILGLVKNSQNIFLQIYNNQVDFSNFNDKEIMLEHGTVLTDYEPYKEVKTTIALPENVELCSLPNGVVDCVDSTGVIHKKIGKMVLDGTGNYGSFLGYTGEGYCYYFEDSRFKVPAVNADNELYYKNSLCTHFTNVYAVWHLNNGKIGKYSDHITLPRKYFISDKPTLEEFKAQLAELQPVLIYELAEDTTQSLSETEITKMQIFPVIIGENNLTGPSETTLLYYDERTEEEQIQSITITNGGKLLPFGLTVDFNKTNLPLIAEAIEASQTITGADGELVLDTTYGSRPFEIDAYTDDFLTPEEKEAKREEIREFLNSIKKVNTKLIIEPLNRTFEVKYAGLAEDTNLPKCVEFLIPLKSASSYAISNTTYTLDGEGELDSNTKEPTGFICTISGEAAYPELSINGYLMSYNNVILNGEQLIIDTRKCTVTKINKVGTKTNAMAYYNHQFPKIQNGTNIVSIISGIENSNLKIEWNDLFL